MQYRQKTKSKNTLLFGAMLSMIFVLPLAWRNSFASTFCQVFGYMIIIYCIISSVQKGSLKLQRSALALLSVALFWLFISIIDSVRFYNQYGTLSGETTFTAPLGSLYYHFFNVLLFIAYIAFVRDKSDVECTFRRALDMIIWIQIITGVIQVMIISGIPGISDIYDKINFLNILQTGSFIKTMGRITMTGSEPASMGTSLGVLSFPYLLAVLQETDSTKETISCWLRLIILIVLAYFSKSTTVYVIMAISALVFVVWFTREGKLSKQMMLIGIAVIVVVLLVMMFASFGGEIYLGSSNILNEIKYYLLIKTTDTENMSTMHRLSPTVNDIAIIKQHPLLGVGDGNQGFTYGVNVPSYMLINPKSQDFANGIGGVVNGGAWFWAVLSGYGIVGSLALFVWYFNHYRPAIKSIRTQNRFLYRVFIFALPAIIVTLFAGAMEPKILFILSIPFWQIKHEERVV